MVNRIYPPELQLNKANTADTEAPFLDLHLSISNGFVSSKIYDKRDDFDFEGSAVAQWWSVGLRSERSGVRNLPPPCCVLEQDTLLPESTGYLPRKRWLRPDMTEKLLTGTLSLNTTNQL